MDARVEVELNAAGVGLDPDFVQGRLREEPSASECASFRAKFHTVWSEVKFSLSTW